MICKTKSFLLSATLSLAVASGTVKADVVIGVAGPFSGAYANFGEQLWRGASAAAESINAKGGINGEKIQLVKGDDACEPKQAIAVANRFVTVDKVSAVLGHFCSSSSIPANDVYADAEVISMSPGSTSPRMTEGGLSTVFRNCGRDDQQGIVAAHYIVDVLKAKRVAIIHDKDTYGQGVADATKVELHKAGITEVLYEGLTRGEKDFNALVTKIRSVNPDVVYFGGIHAEAGPLVRQMREQGVTARFISDDAIVTDEFVSVAGGAKYVDGVLMTFGADPRNNPAGKAVVEKFRASGFEPEGYTMYAYTGIEAIAAALTATHNQGGEAAADWLKDNPVSTATGTKEWDSKGDLKVSGYVMYLWGPDGKYKQL